MTDIIALDLGAAERLDKRIRLMAGTVRENLHKLAGLVEEAKQGHIHAALGFPSWTAYLADALGGQLELTTDTRRDVVELLAGEGMSNRAIAATVGVSEGTIRNDKVRSDYAPAEPVVGLDGKTYKPIREREPEPVIDADEDDEQPGDPTVMDQVVDELLAAAGLAQEPEPKRAYPAATFANLMKRLADLTRIAEEAEWIAGDVEFTGEARYRGEVYDGDEQYDKAQEFAADLVVMAEQIRDATEGR